MDRSIIFATTSIPLKKVFSAVLFSSRIQWTRRWPDTPFNMGVTAGHTQNTQSKTVQVTLPTVNLNMSRITLGRFTKSNLPLKRLLDNVGLTASADLANTVSENERLFAFNKIDSLNLRSRNGLRIQSAASTSLRAGVIGTLSASINGTLVNTIKYSQSRFDEAQQAVQTDTLFGLRSAFNWNASANFNSRIYGTYPFRRSENLKAIRHVVQLNVGASYSPYSNYGGSLFSNRGDFLGYNPFDVAQFQPSNSSQQLNGNFGITQNFEAKIRDRKASKITYNKVKLLDNFKIGLNRNFLADSLNWSNVNMSAFTTIAKNITLNYSSSYSLYDRDSTGREVDVFYSLPRAALFAWKQAIWL